MIKESRCSLVWDNPSLLPPVFSHVEAKTFVLTSLTSSGIHLVGVFELAVPGLG